MNFGAIELITGFVTAPDTTITAVTFASGNNGTIRNQKGFIGLLNAWVDAQAAGVLRILSPKLHDNVTGLRVNTVASEVYPLFPDIPTRLYAQDTLTVGLSGSAVAGDIESVSYLVGYEDPDLGGKFIGPAELAARMTGQFLTVPNTLSLGTAGGYSGEEAINAEFDQFRPNTKYALVGYEVSAECCSIGWRGADTGNYRVGGPGNETNKNLTRSWFLDLSKRFGIGCIPVLDSAAKDSFLIDGVQDENGTDVTVNSIFAELKQ